MSNRKASLIVVAICLLLVAASLSAQRGPAPPEATRAGSRVQYKTYMSALMFRELRYGLYLPPSYEMSGTRKYPILYFLHGLGENEMRWSTRGEGDLILERMGADNSIGEFIVAVPVSSSNGFYTNVRNGGAPWEDALVKEFIPMIESAYRVNPTRATRGISGISMGGYGALKVAMKHPEMFGSVSAHSAALVPDFGTAAPIVKLYLGLADTIFGIGFAGPKPDFSYWDANSPLELAKNTARLQGMKIYFDCGTEDMYGFYDGHKVLDDVLTKATYPHTAELHPGPHGWNFTRQHMRTSLLFHWNAFQGK